MTAGRIRTVLGDIEGFDGVAYAHEHLVLDSPLIADRFPHILLDDVDAAVAEVGECRAAGAGLMVDTMPVSAGRDVVRLAEISTRTGVPIVAATGLHHDRYYGPLHWTNRVGADELTALFVADLIEGVDEFDYISPVVRRTPHRAGLAKVATSGEVPDARDLRNIEAVAAASVATGAPVLTHCEGGRGGIAQVELLVAAGVPAPSIIVSHVDKAQDLAYLHDLAETGAILDWISRCASSRTAPRPSRCAPSWLSSRPASSTRSCSAPTEPAGASGTRSAGARGWPGSLGISPRY